MRSTTATFASTRRPGALRRWVVRATFALLVASAGCKQIDRITKPNKDEEYLEAELRTREREIGELRAENLQLKQLVELYQRQGYSGPQGVITGPVLLGSSGAVAVEKPSLISTISLGTGTGGYDADGQPGDELLQVVIVPKDDDGTAVKVPARASIAAYEIAKEGHKIPIGQWNVTGDDLKRSWKQGFLGSGGFHVPLQWDQAPATDKVRVNVRLTAQDGKTFEADKDVNVKPMPGLGTKVEPPLTMPSKPGTSVIPPVGTVLDPGGVLPQPGALLPMPEFPGSTPLPEPRPVGKK